MRITKTMQTNDVAELLSAEPVVTTTTPTWERAKDGDQLAVTEWLKEVDPVIKKGVGAFAGGDKAYMTQARILALGALKSYDKDAGASINTHVYNALRRLQRTSAQRSNLAHISEDASIARNNILRAIREWKADNDGDPTTEDIATKLGMTPKRVDAIMNMKPILPDSLSTNEHGDQFSTSQDNTLDLYDRCIYNDLDKIDKKIYEWSTGYGLGEKLPGIEIAKRLNITPAAVSKRYAKITQKFGEEREIIRRTING